MYPFTDLDSQINDLSEDLQISEENLGELYAQYSSEVALYGDAGPGQMQAIERMERHIARLRQELDGLLS